MPNVVPLSSRSHSLTFSDIYSLDNPIVDIAESEKALLVADIEADVKYKQLIHDAEAILISMRSFGLKETPSPNRRICNVPPNKRVEMLRSCEADLRREAVKQKSSGEKIVDQEDVTYNQEDILDIIPISSCPKKIPFHKIVNTRFSPKKTHVTNFINQNSTTVPYLQNSNDDFTFSTPYSSKIYETNMKRSPGLQFNVIQAAGKRKKILVPRSPAPRRRAHSQPPYNCIGESETDSDTNLERANKIISMQIDSITWNEKVNLDMRKKQEHARYIEHLPLNNISNREKSSDPNSDKNMMDRLFRSVDIANLGAQYCPQSEPVKRKIYSMNIFGMSSEITEKLLMPSVTCTREVYQQQQQSYNTQYCRQLQIEPLATKPLRYSCNRSFSHQILNRHQKENEMTSLFKRQLILCTIEALKRSLEDQSNVLSGLNDNC